MLECIQGLRRDVKPSLLARHLEVAELLLSIIDLRQLGEKNRGVSLSRRLSHTGIRLKGHIWFCLPALSLTRFFAIRYVKSNLYPIAHVMSHDMSSSPFAMLHRINSCMYYMDGPSNTSLLCYYFLIVLEEQQTHISILAHKLEASFVIPL